MLMIYDFMSLYLKSFIYTCTMFFLGSGYHVITQIEAMIRFQGSVLASLQYEKRA